ncbi:MAG: [Fe-Fe] hydrogenase large subunit C-terminal domain-containing protein [Planctomycetia bacterium]|nr:[Fe-Fe] hydrogenase large subunit C-terminal domain-containing protein [Planctomycetia bacterium]
MMRWTRRKWLKATALAGSVGFWKKAHGQFGWMKPQGGGQRRRRFVPVKENNPAILRHDMNCERCGDCVAICQQVQTVYGHGKNPEEHECIYCGQCTAICWNHGVTERFHLQEVSQAIREKKEGKSKKTFVAITSPAVRVTLGEMFRMAPGTNVEGQLVTALKKLGFDHVFDATFGADLTVMEETAEFLEKLDAPDVPKPFFTSCCPSWVRFVELFFPEFRKQISTCKSPLRMQSAMIKSYFAQSQKIAPEEIVVVAVTPCTAKKYEVTLAGEIPEMDYALTTRELGWWLMEWKIPFAELEETPFDSLLGKGSTSGTIFGNTGGVSDAVLRTASFRLTGKKPPETFFSLSEVRGLEGLRKAEIDLDGRTIRVGILHGTGAAREYLKMAEKMPFDFVEVMACRGGCIGGGGLPTTEIPLTDSLRAARMQGLYATDRESPLRMSHDNPEIQKIYADFLHSPGSETSRKYLHG